ncbi:DUF883 C-terminal domain-containing protein [Legionella quateirensis]|uniref:Bacterial protein of uncharacterized function (DUF883) n=1 Tax=Legionella quateirensis TaxID=45072 RepID=A0A378KX81_9GAMM|nr:DUF883 C-terminal domain-containing protein [Legionella quateirensis]KTD52766.1 hypothetical protein Lqua_0599 [Legionella quateirensis]STY19185.1 Bacterial protein of uncharacterised function (DUF883) [Legionella quateirensis]
MASTKSKVDIKNRNTNSSHVAAAAEDLINEGKKFANEVYQEGVHKVSDAEEVVKEYSDKLVQKIQEKPLTSVLVAAGVGVLLAALLRK